MMNYLQHICETDPAVRKHLETTKELYANMKPVSEYTREFMEAGGRVYSI